MMIDGLVTETSSFTHGKNNLRPNQDAILPPYKVDDGYIMAVADGVGGSYHGEKASHTAISTLQNILLSESFNLDMAKTFNQIKMVLSNQVKQNSAYYNSATTLTVCYINDCGLKIAHSGDTRVYVAQSRKLIQLTKDQTIGAMLLERHPDIPKEYADHKNNRKLAHAISPSLEHNVSIFSYTKKIDAVYIMSDGAYRFWEVNKRVSSNTINDANLFASLIKKRIQKKGAKDDYSLVGVSIGTSTTP